jgi:hypothetical protein
VDQTRFSYRLAVDHMSPNALVGRVPSVERQDCNEMVWCQLREGHTTMSTWEELEVDQVQLGAHMAKRC